VESPLQLLGAVEAFAAGLLGQRAQILAYRGLPGLAATADAVTRLGLPAGLGFDPAGPPWSILRGAARREPVWAVGDPHSLPVQARAVALTGAERVLLLDDGLGTAGVIGRLADPAAPPLIREHVAQPRWRHALGGAASRRLRDLARAGRLGALTAFPVEPGVAAAFRAAGGRLGHHRFDWLRGRPAAAPPPEETVVLGSALAVDGLIDPVRYHAWVAGIAGAATGGTAYLPHRRERPAELAGALPDGVRLVRTELPVELTLRALREPQRVIGLPGTALATLPLVLAGGGARVEAAAIPGDWWTGRATPEFRALTARAAAMGGTRPGAAPTSIRYQA
jgi:hypothetical protein